jgi:hypothetical protein
VADLTDRASSRGGAVREVEVKYRVRDTAQLLAALGARGIDLGAPVQAELSLFAASLGVKAKRTGLTYDSLVRDALTSA